MHFVCEAAALRQAIKKNAQLMVRSRVRLTPYKDNLKLNSKI
jgi:hypothetical protein